MQVLDASGKKVFIFIANSSKALRKLNFLKIFNLKKKYVKSPSLSMVKNTAITQIPPFCSFNQCNMSLIHLPVIKKVLLLALLVH